MALLDILASAFIGMLIFMYGFLPIRIIGNKGKKDQILPTVINGISVNTSQLYNPALTRVVLLVIDALREDFVTGSKASVHMPYLSSVISQGEGMLFTALVEPPTVTLPRIKALTMGTIPNYADVISNVLETDTSGIEEESVIGQASSSNFKIIFYGDETWLRLFPNSFIRFEGTSSFYVSDFTEVDDNVTRHIDKELQNDDWDIMILHYLGLDHIGHVHGPYSSLIPQKLKEMDSVIQRLYQGLIKGESSTLLIVCGDHGMKDTGGHGGATHPETRVPLAFISPKLSQAHGCLRKSETETAVVNQRDLAPTLSALLGLPPPSGNLGFVLPTVMHCFVPDPAALLYTLHVNALQVTNLLTSHGESKTGGYFLFEESCQLHSEWIISEEKKRHMGKVSENFIESFHLRERIIQLYSLSVSESTSRFADYLTKFDYYAISLGVITTWQAFIALIMHNEKSPKNVFKKEILILAAKIFILHVIFCMTGLCSHSSFCEQGLYTYLSMIILAIITAYNAKIVLYRISSLPSWNILGKWEKFTESPLNLFLMAAGVLHAISFASSSFIEEEHQTWQFLCLSLIVLHGVCSKNHQDIEIEKDNETSPSFNFLFSGLKSKSIMELKFEGPELMLENSVQYVDTSSQPFDQDKTRNSYSHDGLIKNTDHSYRPIIYNDVQKDEHFSTIAMKPYRINCQVDAKKFVCAHVLLLFAHRLLRDWNHTGDKWGNLPDIADWISKPENIFIRSVIVIISLVALVFSLIYASLLNVCSINIILSLLSVICVYVYRATIGDVSLFYSSQLSRGIVEFRIFLLLLILFMANGCYRVFKVCNNKGEEERILSSKEGVSRLDMKKLKILAIMMQQLSTIWILFITFLKRPCDIPIIVIYILSCIVLTANIPKKVHVKHGNASINTISLIYVWLGMVFYFHQGNSNSLASIDLQSGYVGQENYKPLTVGILLFCHTFSMPLTSLVLLFHSLVTEAQRSHCNVRILKEELEVAGKTVIFARLLPVVIYLPLLTIQRYHLFVWTVFSPKLMYEVMLTFATLFGLIFLPIYNILYYGFTYFEKILVSS